MKWFICMKNNTTYIYWMHDGNDCAE
jgi:hypothetical protein